MCLPSITNNHNSYACDVKPHVHISKSLVSILLEVLSLRLAFAFFGLTGGEQQSLDVGHWSFKLGRTLALILCVPSSLHRISAILVSSLLCLISGS